MHVCVEHVELNYFLFVAVRKVVAGYKMVAKGHSTVAEWWQLFEGAVEEAGPGDLPNLLRQLKGKTTPTETTPSPQALPMEVGEKTPMLPPPSPVKKEQGSEDPVIVMMGGIRKSTCPQCNTKRGSQNGCDAHIRQAHTGKVLVCAFCSFLSYNLDSMQRHEKEHK